MLRSVSRLALAISVAAPFLIGDVVQPSAYDDVSNLGYSAGNNPGISFAGTDTGNPTDGTSWVSYWTFNLPAGIGPISSATFDLKPRAYFGDGSSETVNFTAFALSPALLGTAYAPNNTTGISVYNALNSGTSYGLLTVQPSDALLDCQIPACPSQPGNTLFSLLDPSALADINADLGGVLVIGVYLSPSSSTPTDNAVGVQFGFLGFSGPVAQLDLTTTPEPGTAWLFAIAGFAAFGHFKARTVLARKPMSARPAATSPAYPGSGVLVTDN
jgi:hypothetical protein